MNIIEEATMKTNFKMNVLKAAIAIIGGMIAANANAGVETSNMTVDATISATCTISTTAVNFGTYDPIVAHKTAALAGTGGVTTTCTNGSAATITLGQGANATATSTDAAPERQMASGTNRLSYQLYSESTRTTVWGNTSTTGKAITGSGTASTETVYGSVPAGQNKPTGTYSDTVVATVTF
jgi:spore coat protein U-like protein